MAERRRKKQADPCLVVGCVRVSSDEQALGPEAQKAAIQAWCGAHAAALVEVQEDIGVSGGTPVAKRPGLNLALDAVANHGAGVLLVAKRDRLARDVIVGAIAERMAKRLGARVRSADGTGNGDGPEHQLMRHLIDCFAAYERALIGARTKGALRVKKSKGLRVGAVPIVYGLCEDGKTLEEDPRSRRRWPSSTNSARRGSPSGRSTGSSGGGGSAPGRAVAGTSRAWRTSSGRTMSPRPGGRGGEP